MKMLKALVFLPFLASCVPNVTKEITRSSKDEAVLKQYAIVRPKWPAPVEVANGSQGLRTMIVAQGEGMKPVGFANVTNFDAFVFPGHRVVRASSAQPPFTAIGSFEFEAKAGKIYRLKAEKMPGRSQGNPLHKWELYEEDTGRVLLRKEVEAQPNRPVPLILPVGAG